jgi:hypothetical protein
MQAPALQKLPENSEMGLSLFYLAVAAYAISGICYLMSKYAVAGFSLAIALGLTSAWILRVLFT